MNSPISSSRIFPCTEWNLCGEPATAWFSKNWFTEKARFFPCAAARMAIRASETAFPPAKTPETLVSKVCVLILIPREERSSPDFSNTSGTILPTARMTASYVFLKSSHPNCLPRERSIKNSAPNSAMLSISKSRTALGRSSSGTPYRSMPPG